MQKLSVVTEYLSIRAARFDLFSSCFIFEHHLFTPHSFLVLFITPAIPNYAEFKREMKIFETYGRIRVIKFI